MKKTYDETYYETNHGYFLYHAYGENAAGSTMQSIHCEGDFIVFFFLRGTGNLKVEGKQYDIAEGDIVVVNPREFYQLNVDSDKFHERISLNTNEILLKYFPDGGNQVFMNLFKRKKRRTQQDSCKYCIIKGS